MTDVHGLLDKLRKETASAGSVAHWARTNDVSSQYVFDVLSGRRPPGAKIVNALGYVEVKSYVRKGEDDRATGK